MLHVAIGKKFPDKVIPFIKKARHTIDIVVYDWRWYPDQTGSKVQIFNREIAARASAGIKVRALLNTEKIVHRLRDVGITARRIPSGKILHSKLMIIDQKVSILGSHNYTTNAFSINFESSIIVEHPETAKEFTKYFNNLFAM